MRLRLSPTGSCSSAHTDGFVMALDSQTGKLHWARRLPSFVYASAAVAGSRVFVGSYDHRLYALMATTGKRLWSFKGQGPVSGTATVVGKLVFFSTCGSCSTYESNPAARRTYALDASSGRLVWTYPDGEYTPVVTDGLRIYLTGYARSRPWNRATPAANRANLRPFFSVERAVRFRVAFILAAATAALVACAAASAYPWPVKPFDRQHPIRAYFGDPRTRFWNTMLTDGLRARASSSSTTASTSPRRRHGRVSGRLGDGDGDLRDAVAVRTGDDRTFQYSTSSPSS